MPSLLLVPAYQWQGYDAKEEWIDIEGATSGYTLTVDEYSESIR